MPMIQSEGHVWPAFAALAKSVTRRNWQPSTAAHYVKGYQFDAWSTAPFAGGVKIGEAVCTCNAYQQPLRETPDDHYQREGFAWLHDHPLAIPKAARKEIWAQGKCSWDAFDRWRWSGGTVWVCEFEITLITDIALTMLADILQETIPPAEPGKLF